MTQQTELDSLVSTSPPRMTYEEFLDRMDEHTHAEWVNGEVVMMAPISDEHQHVVIFLLSILNPFVQDRKLGVVLCEPFQMKLGPDLPGRSPDVFFVGSENRGRLRKTYVDGPADLAVEIISPGSRGRDRGDKFYEYEQGGVREYWLIDPARHQAEFYQLGPDRIYHAAPIKDGVFRSNVMTGLYLKVDWLWERPPVLTVMRELGLFK